MQLTRKQNWITVSFVLANLFVYTVMVGFNILASFSNNTGAKSKF